MDELVYVGEYQHVGKRHPDCPLRFVPEHGRLIDLDAVIDSTRRHRQTHLSIGHLDVLPVIIEASTSSE